MNVDISIYDADDRRIRTLCHDDRQPGKHVLEWDGSTDSGGVAPSGTYDLRVAIEGVGIVARFKVVLR